MISLDQLFSNPESEVRACNKDFLGWSSTCQFLCFHDDVIKWKHFPRYWPFVRGIHRSPVIMIIKWVTNVDHLISNELVEQIQLMTYFLHSVMITFDWELVTHIGRIVGSGDGLKPIRRKTITWTNYDLSYRSHRDRLQSNLYRKKTIFVTKINLKRHILSQIDRFYISLQ